jgi:hypothetical protein
VQRQAFESLLEIPANFLPYSRFVLIGHNATSKQRYEMLAGKVT